MRGAGVSYAYAYPHPRLIDGDPRRGHADVSRRLTHTDDRDAVFLTHADCRDVVSLSHISAFGEAHEDTDARRRQPHTNWLAAAGNRDPWSGGNIDADSRSGGRNGARRDDADAGAGRGDRP